MRVLGCGVSPPPDKRQFSNVDSIVRNAVVKSKLGVGSNSFPRRIPVESAESLAKDSALGPIARDEESDSHFLRSWKTRRNRLASAFSSLTRVCEEKFLRPTCLVPENWRQRIQYFCVLTPVECAVLVGSNSLSLSQDFSRHI